MNTFQTDGRGERIVGEKPLRAVERFFRALDRPFAAIPKSLDPMRQTGAVANTTLIIAVVTGILLLVWYVPSVHRAYDSVAAMMHSRFSFSGIVRSVHRYSSDAAMFFVLLHAIRVTAERRFGGARWVAWVTGLFSMTLLLGIGWLGYWLVWDEPAQEIAITTARVLDVVPIFAEPFSKSFLTDDTINSLLFFLVFFSHMLIPLGMVIGLWLHISRLRRAEFLTGRTLTVLIVVSLVLVSIALPAPLGERATMARTPDAYPMDLWYMGLLALAERLNAAAMWSLMLVAGVVAYAIPWLLVRTRVQKARVEPSRCDECLKCVADCPYGAISMVPRGDPNSRRPTTAWVDPNLCVGCGICSGSCDSSGIGLDWLPAPAVRIHTDRWFQETHQPVVYVCEPSRPPDLVADPETGICAALPGVRVVLVPCAGWVHPLTVERAFRKGAPGVVIVGCPDGACPYREGGRTTEERMTGKREPALRVERIDPSHLVLLRRPLVTLAEIREAVDAAVAGRPPRSRRIPAPIAAAVGVLAVFAITIGASHIPWRTSYSAEPVITIALKHPGANADVCRERTADELAALPVHMRQPTVCERGRADVRVRVYVDDALSLEETVVAGGVNSDGIAVALFRVHPGVGEHLVRVDVADGADDVWNFSGEHTFDLASRERAVVRFERGQYTWSDHAQ